MRVNRFAAVLAFWWGVVAVLVAAGVFGLDDAARAVYGAVGGVTAALYIWCNHREAMRAIAAAEALQITRATGQVAQLIEQSERNRAEGW